MPFKKINIEEMIKQELEKDAEFKEKWEASKNEYNIIRELIFLRKNAGLTQTALAKQSGNRQQVISRIETGENSPTINTLCAFLDILGYEIKIVPKLKNIKL